MLNIITQTRTDVSTGTHADNTYRIKLVCKTSGESNLYWWTNDQFSTNLQISAAILA